MPEQSKFENMGLPFREAVCSEKSRNSRPSS